MSHFDVMEKLTTNQAIRLYEGIEALMNQFASENNQVRDPRDF